jgi:lysozyme
MNRALGADVSHWTGQVNFSKLATAVSFVGIKASEGTANVDQAFATNLAAARAQPFELVIAYHVARPGDGAAQAARFAQLVGDLRPNERLALDTERSSAVGVDFLQAFFGELPRDRRPILYTSNGVWTGMGNPAFVEAADVDLWLPRYGAHAEPQVPDPWFNIGRSWTFWQDSQTGAVPGVTVACDTNVFNGTIDQLRAYAELAAPRAA